MYAVLQVDEVTGAQNPVDIPSGAEDSKEPSLVSDGKKKREMHFSPRPGRKPYVKDKVPWETWYANYKERMRASKQLKETFYSYT